MINQSFTDDYVVQGIPNGIMRSSYASGVIGTNDTNTSTIGASSPIVSLNLSAQAAFSGLFQTEAYVYSS